MQRWLSDEIIATGRGPLLTFLIGFIVGFLCIRISVRLIRAEVKWWFGNISSGGVHVHHVVFGVVLTMGAGLGLIATGFTAPQWVFAIFAGVFGLGAALVLDEFALIFYLRDVYWQEEGRASVDAVFVAIAVGGMLLLGFRPLAALDIGYLIELTNDHAIAGPLRFGFVMLNLLLTALVLAKGKIWTGLVGMFVVPLLIVGALRLARPGSPWARWRYADRPKLMAKALRRERRLRRPFIRAKIFLQDLMAGRPDVPHIRRATAERLNEVVHPAPPPPPRMRDSHPSLGDTISFRKPGSGTIVGLPREPEPSETDAEHRT